MLDLSKFDTKTRDGTPVRNLRFTVATKRWPIRGQWLDGPQAVWVSAIWDSEGRYEESGKDHYLDLVIREEKKPRVF